MQKVIWLNHWFSTAYNIIKLLRKDDYFQFRVIGTSEAENSVLKQVCDEWYSEPANANDDEYIEFCIRFCKEHNVDVFIPHRHLLTVSKCKKSFENIGVQVLVDDYEIVSILGDKQKAYCFFKDNPVVEIPDYHVVDNSKDFLAAYELLSKDYGQICFKFVKDEGGKSYRLIDNNRKGYAALFKKQNTRMTLDAVLEALAEREYFAPMMVMPYLGGVEISVDCLKTDAGNIMIPRIKGSKRFEVVRYDDKILNMCEAVLDVTALKCPCNIQFKYLNDVPYFLEVNTRMSGGIHMTCLAANVNIPNIAVNKLLGKDKEWNIDRKERVISQVETPIILE